MNSGSCAELFNSTLSEIVWLYTLLIINEISLSTDENLDLYELQCNVAVSRFIVHTKIKIF